MMARAIAHASGATFINVRPSTLQAKCVFSPAHAHARMHLPAPAHGRNQQRPMVPTRAALAFARSV